MMMLVLLHHSLVTLLLLFGILARVESTTADTTGLMEVFTQGRVTRATSETYTVSEQVLGQEPVTIGIDHVCSEDG